MKNNHNPVTNPAHYTDGKIEVIDFIEDKALGFRLGNAVKYIARAGKKDPAKRTEDLQKAAWYLNREIEKTSGPLLFDPAVWSQVRCSTTMQTASADTFERKKRIITDALLPLCKLCLPYVKGGEYAVQINNGKVGRETITLYFYRASNAVLDVTGDSLANIAIAVFKEAKNGN